MSNMSYCRFRNTSQDLEDCADNIHETLSGDEAKARRKLILTCFRIVNDFIDENGKLDIELVNDLPVE